MILGDCLKLKMNDVVSVVGAGGKTSLIMYLANYLNGRCVLGPSTKMYKPTEVWPCYINKPYSWTSNEGVIVTAQMDLGEKIAGLNPYAWTSGFDYYLIEADGSRGLALKGWGPKEPVVVNETTVTIGVVDMTAMGMAVNEDNIFRVEVFKAMTEDHDLVSLKGLARMIVDEKGLFKNSQGRRVLFLNKAETEDLVLCAEQLVQVIRRQKVSPQIELIIIGSVVNGIGYVRGLV